MAVSDEIALTLTRGSWDNYVLRGAAQPASLKLSSWRSRAIARVGDESYELSMSGVIDRGACARRLGQEQPIIRIGRKSCVLPVAGSATWRVRARWSGHDATLRVAELGEIGLHLGRRSRSDLLARVYGQWLERDLTVLTAAFVLLLRRRDDTASGAAGAMIAATASFG